MATETGSLAGTMTQVVAWRREQLLAARFQPELADQLAADWRFDLHALIELVELGCEPALAVRILAPLVDDAPDPSYESRDLGCT
jgi:hypothetical protein